ncbi:MAG: fructosamine kinase family protein [Thermonemataceae bacterium]
MLNNEQVEIFESILFQAFGENKKVASFEVLTGGCINNAVHVATRQKESYFIKYNQDTSLDLFEAEAKGLHLLQHTGAISIPEVLGVGEAQGYKYLLLEFLPDAYPKPDFWQNLGTSLAHLHAHTQTYFGLDHNNYIGSLRQSNEFLEDGITFFIEKRLKVQAGLAYYNQLLSQKHLEQFDKFYTKLPHLLPKEKPALLHGDLWNGNVIVDKQGQPALIDPAVHYGLRESEIAFTQLFGGFDDEFLDMYHEAFPLEEGIQQRYAIYNLYPLLVHLNLFGSGYLKRIEQTLKRFL